MDALLAALEGSSLASALRFSRWGYAAVNTAHVLGLATLFGSILALDLRLLGLWRATDPGALLHVLPRVAAAGLALAIVTGFLLFSVRAPEYAALDVFRLKMVFVFAGTTIALYAAWRGGLAHATPSRRAAFGAASLAAWSAALVSGRMIAFAEG